MKNNIEQLEKGIIEGLPQIPYIIDQVGEAMQWVKDEKSEKEVYKIFKSTYDVVGYTSLISNPNFYKTRLVLASLLSEIPNVFESSKFTRFDNPSKSVETAIKDLKIDESNIGEKGCFKAITMHVMGLANKDEELLSVFLIHVFNDLKEIISGMQEVDVKAPITPQDYITILGYALVLANMDLSNLSLLNETSDIINKIRILLNNKVVY